MMIHFWDMDYTLVNNDCDVSWKQFLVEQKIAPPSDLEEADKFYQQYLDKKLDIDEFIKFQLKEFRQNTPQRMRQLCQLHFDTIVKPNIFPKAETLIKSHLLNPKIIVCLITATNNYIAQPLANHLGIKHLKATFLEEQDNTFSGSYLPPYCCGANKIDYMKKLIRELNLPSDIPTAYYGDSINDVPIFEWVDQAFVINPNLPLKTITEKNNWTALSF